jgi:HEAT repeat protein
MALGPTGYSQPIIPKEQIPSNIPIDIRKEIEALYSSDPIERAYAAYHLGKMGKRSIAAIPFLIETLGDTSAALQWFVGGSPSNTTSPAIEARKALIKIGKPSIDPLISALKNRSVSVRRNAAFALGHLRDFQTADALLITLKDDSSEVRAAAAWAIGEINDPKTTSLLESALASEGDYWASSKIAEALWKIDRSRAVSCLIDTLKHKNPKIRQMAASQLKVHDAFAVQALIAALKDDDPYVRGSAAASLSWIKDPTAVEPLISALGDRNWLVQKDAASALGKIRDSRAVRPLIQALKDSFWHVQWSAALALGEIGDPLAVEPLIEALKNKERNVVEGAMEALEKITGNKLAKDPERWQKWWQENKTR